MYIAKIRIENLRCFKDTEIRFNKGLNVIIGENNSGKSTIFKALRIIFDRYYTKQFTIDDFFKGQDDSGSKPPEIKVTIILESSEDDTNDDRAVVSSWLTKLESPWQATLTYTFFLPEKNAPEFEEKLKDFKKDSEDSNRSFWLALEELLPKYVSKIYGGNFSSKNSAEREFLDKFDCETLDAIRDVESRMFTGQNPLLRQVLNYFFDYRERNEGKKNSIDEKDKEFKENAVHLIENIKNRINREEILKLARDTGAEAGGIPEIGGELTKKDIVSVLKLLINDKGLEIPITNNGLGYNNLIYISLILSKFEMMRSGDALGENARVFPFLLIEEPEAHLHPPMQYQFLKFLDEEIKRKKRSRQIFITSHSTHITSAVKLDSIIGMSKNDDNSIMASYPGKVFSEKPEELQSKKYVERFLDATKSNMLFSKGVIFVEGLAEQILLPCLAEYLNYPLEKNHVSVVRVDGLTFKHFIKIFGARTVWNEAENEERNEFALLKRVSCIVDVDPQKREKVNEQRFKACWPFELDVDSKNYEFQKESSVITKLNEMVKNIDNVKIFSNQTGYGKTFEYDLAWENANDKFWLPREFKISQDKNLIELIKNSSLDGEEIHKAKIASTYLLNVSGRKGESAFELEQILRDNLGENEFIVPKYIADAIKWVCCGK